MRDRIQKLLPDVRLLVCILLGIVVYLPTLRGEFVWDDTIFVGRWVGSTDTLWEILFPSPAVIGTRYYYRPITQGFATLLWAVFGETPPYWHAAIVLIHAVTIGLVYSLLREWWLAADREGPRVSREWAAIIGAGFFAVWPANAESVAWISSRADTLLGPFLLGAMILHLRARDRRRRPVGAALLFLCSLLVKETGIVFLPMAAAATLLLPLGSSQPRNPEKLPFKPWAPELWLPHLLVYFVYSLMRKTSMGSGVGLTEVALEMLGTLDPGRIFGAWGFYVQEALSLGAAPPFLRDPPPPQSVAGFAVLGIVAIVACVFLLLRARTRPVALAAAWFFLPLGPPLATVSAPLSQNSVTVHYLYIPNVALAALAGFAALWISNRAAFAQYRKWALAPLFAVAVLCGLVAHERYQPWMDSRDLWWRAIEDNPYSCIAHQNYAISSWVAEDEEAGLRHLRIAAYVCRPPDSSERHGALVALSQFYMTKSQWANARTALGVARELEGNLFMLGRSMELQAALLIVEKMGAAQGGTVTLRRDDLRRAIAVLEDATRIDPFGTGSRVSLGLLYRTVGERPRALHVYEEVRRIASSESTRRLVERQIESLEKEIEAETDPMRRAYERGQRADLAGRLDDALAGYEAALAIEPDRGDILLALADVHARKGDRAGATRRATEATEREPDSAIAWFNLGIYLAEAGDLAEAEAAFGRARERAPGWAKACLNHGRALQLLARRRDAATAYETCLENVSPTDLDARRDLERALELTQIVPPPHGDKNGPRAP